MEWEEDVFQKVESMSRTKGEKDCCSGVDVMKHSSIVDLSNIQYQEQNKCHKLYNYRLLPTVTIKPTIVVL